MFGWHSARAEDRQREGRDAPAYAPNYYAALVLAQIANIKGVLPEEP